jgi:hypothetical protein
MVTVDEKFVPRMQPHKMLHNGKSGDFPILSSIAISASQYQIPDPIDIRYRIKRFQGMRQEMIHVGDVWRLVIYGDV